MFAICAFQPPFQIPTTGGALAGPSVPARGGGRGGTVFPHTKVASARVLRYEWGRSLREHPRAPEQKSASTNHDIGV